MKPLKESLLSDIEDTIKAGDDFAKSIKKAEKDYKKLLAKSQGKRVGQYYFVTIKSPELAYFIAHEHPVYKHFSQENKNIYDIDLVQFIYELDDAFDGNKRRYMQVNVSYKTSKIITLIASHLEYCDKDENIDTSFDPSDGLSIQECIKIISKAFTKKYHDINDFKEAFISNVKYTVKY